MLILSARHPLFSLVFGLSLLAAGPSGAAVVAPEALPAPGSSEPSRPGTPGAGLRPKGALSPSLRTDVLAGNERWLAIGLEEQWDFQASALSRARTQGLWALGAGAGFELGLSATVEQLQHIGPLALVEHGIRLRWAPRPWGGWPANPSLQLSLRRGAMASPLVQLGATVGGALAAWGQWGLRLDLQRSVRALYRNRGLAALGALWWWPDARRLGLGIEAAGRLAQQADLLGDSLTYQVQLTPLIAWRAQGPLVLLAGIGVGRTQLNLGDGRGAFDWFAPRLALQLRR